MCNVAFLLSIVFNTVTMLELQLQQQNYSIKSSDRSNTMAQTVAEARLADRLHDHVDDSPAVVALCRESTTKRVAKRTFDILFSFTFLVTVFPLMYAFIAYRLRKEGPGDVFFKQERTGLNNKTFHIYKFRTMSPEKCDNTTQATKGDARVTAFGEFLRKNSLDEFPQFINVLRGEMSIVGPRPHMLSHTDQYSHLIPNYNDRHLVKPGVTGWAQVNGWRGPTEELWKMEGRVEHDLEYISKSNMFLDVKCILKTIGNLTGEEEGAV